MVGAFLRVADVDAEQVDFAEAHAQREVGPALVTVGPVEKRGYLFSMSMTWVPPSTSLRIISGFSEN